MGESRLVSLEEIAVPRRGAFAMGPFGSDIKTDNFVEFGVPIIRGGNLGRGKLVEEGFVFLTEEKADELANSQALPGDIVITHRGTLGQVVMVPRRSRYPRYIVSQSQMKVTLDESRAYPEFVTYYLQSPAGQHALLKYASQVGVPSIAQPLTSLRKVVVPLPSMAEQHAMAGVLGALDERLESNRRSAALSEELADLIYLGISNGWREVALLDLAAEGTLTFSDGYRTRADQLGHPGVPILRVADMSDCHFTVANGTDHVSLEYTARAAEKCSKPGDVIVSTKGTVGRTAMLRDGDPHVVYSPQICFFRSSGCGALSPSVLHRWARVGFRRQAMDVKSQTDMAPYVNLGDLGRMTVPVPPSGGGDEVRQLEELDQLAAGRRRESSCLEQLRDALLPELLSGRLRVREAERVIEDVV